MTRTALLREARKGDRESLARLILPYSPGVYLGALRLTGNPADAEDVRQEAFLKTISRLEQFTGTQQDSRDELHAWVSRIASNAAIDVLRKRRDSKLFSLEQPASADSEETLGSNVAASGDNPEERLARLERRKLMADAISQLAPDLRRVCLLRDVLQYSTQEVATRLGVSAMAVRLRLFRAHRRLREQLSATAQPPKDRQASVPAFVEAGLPRFVRPGPAGESGSAFSAGQDIGPLAVPVPAANASASSLCAGQDFRDLRVPVPTGKSGSSVFAREPVSPSAPERITRRAPEPKRAPAIPYGAYASYACGD